MRLDWLQRRMTKKIMRRARYRPKLEQFEGRFLLSTFTVINTADSGAGSLRQAILDANATPNVGGVPDQINFNIPGAGVQKITPLAPGLPIITDPVVIDGYTQPGASKDTNGPSQADNAVLQIEIDGSDPGGNANGLVIGGQGTGSTIRGLVIDNGFGAGILVQATNVTVK